MSKFKQTFTIIAALLALFIIQFNTASAAVFTETKLKANFVVADEAFGESVALFEQRIVVGAPQADGFTDDSGRIYYYEPDGSGGWLENTLVGRDLESSDRYGHAAAAAEDIIIVGAPGANSDDGAIFVYEADGAGWWTEWNHSESFAGGGFGFDVAVTDEYIVAGAPHAIQGTVTIIDRPDQSGGYYFYTLSRGIDGSRFGYSVAAAGNRIVVGAPDDLVGNRSTGSVYVLERNSNDEWIETRLVPSDQQFSMQGPEFGDSVALVGNRIVVGAPFADTAQGPAEGAVYIYEPDGAGGWAETKLSASDGYLYHKFGDAVAAAGDRVLVGADPGQAYLYELNGAGGWDETKLLPGDDPFGEYFGYAVAAAGDRIAVGAPSDSEGQPNSGAAYLFDTVSDVDQDGVPDEVDNCPAIANPGQADFDGDGQGDACDIDDDNDGVNDAADAFPLNPDEWLDSDGDGIGNNADIDDDNDGQLDHHEVTCGSDPLNAASQAPDFDGDNVPDCVDPDIDNDGYANAADAFPYDPTEWNDNDGDGSGDNADPDDDNDGQLDANEIACGSDPLNAASLSPDFDGDNVPDCVDPDIDNDGYANADDAFPYDPTEWNDNDGDGIGDNADPDDDNDGQLDADEIACGSDPFDAASLSPDFDGDMIPDCVDPDDDNDGVLDGDDLCGESSLTDDAPPQPKKNRFFVNADGDFVDGEGTSSGYTISDTGGCTSKQIIVAAELGYGHSKYGISRSALEAWIASVP